MTARLLKIESLMLASAVLLGACSTVPTSTPTLDEARASFVAANNNPQVAANAPLEFKQASDALEQANQAAAKRESLANVDKLAYLAKQRIATAQEVAKAKSAEAEIQNAGRERTQVQLEARTAEAERARREAAQAQAQAQNAQAQVADARAQTADAQAQAQSAQAQAAQLAERAARLEALLIDLHAQKTERGMVVTIGDVLFATDRAELNANGVATVRKLADVMAQNPDRTVLVEGFTDSTGSAAHNQDLSERRAASVAQGLIGMGIPRERVATRGYGAAYPVASNDTASSRQQNRRVEIVLSNPGATIPQRAPQR
jgi:outer membrane protein OmpA-like peptidoglycan-associated protein